LYAWLSPRINPAHQPLTSRCPNVISGEMDTRPARLRARPWSLPNVLTYGRILAVPALVAIMFVDRPTNSGADWSEYPNWIALAIFLAACITDFFDGYLARVWSQQSSLGQMLDPIADKLLVGSALVMLVANGTIRGWAVCAAIIILCREILVSGLREYLAELRVKVAVTWLAKWKTTVQMVAIGFLIAGEAGDRVLLSLTAIDGLAMYIGLFLLWIAAVVTLYTGYDYFRAGLRHMID
jgi:cardiolipin synthase (CMP-forming)